MLSFRTSIGNGDSMKLWKIGFSVIGIAFLLGTLGSVGCSGSSEEPEPEYEIKKAPEGRVSPTRMKQ